MCDEKSHIFCSYSVMVITSDSDSDNVGSIPTMNYELFFIIISFLFFVQ